MMSKLKIIPGFKFIPEDHEIILYYLRRKINGQQLPCDGIREFDIYGKRGPWELVRSKEQPPAYVFALSRNRTANRKTRTCSFGTWKYQTSESIFYGGREIGTKTLLTFIPNNGIDPNPGSWHMSEYSLPDCKDKEVTVLCKVGFRELPKGRVRNRAAMKREGLRITKAKITSPSDASKNNAQIKLEDASYCNNNMKFAGPFSTGGNIKPESAACSRGDCFANSVNLNGRCKIEPADCNVENSAAGLEGNNHVGITDDAA